MNSEKFEGIYSQRPTFNNTNFGSMDELGKILS